MDICKPCEENNHNCQENPHETCEHLERLAEIHVRIIESQD